MVTYDVLFRVAASIGAKDVLEDLLEDLVAATAANQSQCSNVTCEWGGEGSRDWGKARWGHVTVGKGSGGVT